MAIGISITKEDLETLTTRIALTGLVAGTKYDVYRVQYRNLGKDDTGTRRYERELPDRRALWSAVGHRINWPATATTASFRDFECPKRPTKYFCCQTSVVGPHEYDFGDGKYPMSRGALSTELVHWAGDIADIFAEPDQGHILVRSIHELAHYAETCLVEMDGPTYTARVNEHAVMGNEYPVIISDTREARRGSVTLMTRNLGQYNALRRIVFPASGRIRPVLLQGGGDATLLLDDMRIIPLDVEVEQATQKNPDIRYVTIDYVEADPSAPLIARAGDNDSLAGTTPVANFSISDTTPAAGDWVTLTDTSTGTGDDWEWTVDNAADNRVGKFYTQGPHQARFFGPGEKTVKLRFGGAGEGYNSRFKIITVH
jgi:hypothetical protein